MKLPRNFTGCDPGWTSSDEKPKNLETRLLSERRHTLDRVAQSSEARRVKVYRLGVRVQFPPLTSACQSTLVPAA